MFEILLDQLSPRRQSLFYFFNFVWEEKEVNLGNNPKKDHDRANDILDQFQSLNELCHGIN
jgi:hypothetical protein